MAPPAMRVYKRDLFANVVRALLWYEGHVVVGWKIPMMYTSGWFQGGRVWGCTGRLGSVASEPASTTIAAVVGAWVTVGAALGDKDGVHGYHTVGACEVGGVSVGAAVGCGVVGSAVVGSAVVGRGVGAPVGEGVGLVVGKGVVGAFDGLKVASLVVGPRVDGASVGLALGAVVGLVEGLVVGVEGLVVGVDVATGSHEVHTPFSHRQRLFPHTSVSPDCATVLK